VLAPTASNDARARSATALDFILRLAFFAAAPFLLVFVAALFPVTGALIQIGITLGVFFASEAVRKLADRSRVVRVALSSMLDFEAYYRARTPRPFLYYVFYPILFPYWLFASDARREFLLFKGYTLASFVLLLVSLVLQYVSNFPPELTLRDFLPIAAGTFLAETIVVLMFLMPIVTTVVHFHGARAPRRLAALLVVATISVGIAVVRLERPRDPVVSFATRARLRLRTAARPAAAREAQLSALREAWKTLPMQKQDVDRDGKVNDLPLERARAKLASFYKDDEAYAFDLWFQRKAGHAILVVYFESRDGRGPVWLAIDEKGAAIADSKRLPRGAFVAMKHAADAAE